MPNLKPEDVFFLKQLEAILIMLLKENHAYSFDELKKMMIAKARVESKSLSLSKQLEFIALINELLEAYHFASEKHKDQKRASGEPYIMHPLHVALSEIFQQEHYGKKYSESPIIAALLHDTVEDTDTQYSDITNQFGKRMEGLVENLTKKPIWDKWKKDNLLSNEERAALQFQSANRDNASLEIKFQDRLHNLETLRHMEPKSRFDKILETITSGLIEHAEDQKMYMFLIQLYICIKMYMTNEAITQFSKDVSYASEKRTWAIEKIRKILHDHREEIVK